VVRTYVDVCSQYQNIKGCAQIVLKKVNKNTIDALTEKQRVVFDSYIKYRSLDKVATEIGDTSLNVLSVYRSNKFQLALKEYNASILDKVNYNTAVIIDELWKTYHQEGINHKDKIAILTLLGKHIGMWANTVKDQSKPSVQYNIVNYNHGIPEEIKKHEKEIEAQVIEESSIPEGFEIATYGE